MGNMGPSKETGILFKGGTEAANSASPLFTSQGPFLPLKRSLKTWFTTTRRTASLVSPPSAMQKSRNGKNHFLGGGDFAKT